MSTTDCPRCGGNGRLATNIMLDLYRCTKCRQEYWVEHPQCQWAGCNSWADNGMDYCWYHANLNGTKPDDWDEQAHCSICGAVVEDGKTYCETHEPTNLELPT